MQEPRFRGATLPRKPVSGQYNWASRTGADAQNGDVSIFGNQFPKFLGEHSGLLGHSS
jgi:hypothetical protein